MEAGTVPAQDDKTNLVRKQWPIETRSDKLLEEVNGDKTTIKSRCSKVRGVIFPAIVLCIIIGLIVMLFVINNTSNSDLTPADTIQYECGLQNNCSISLTESIPENLTYPSGAVTHTPTYKTWIDLITGADKSIQISSMYWTLLNNDTGNTSFPSSDMGEFVFVNLLSALKRGVKIQIVQDAGFSEDADTQMLKEAGAIVRSINMTSLVGGGVLHTKFILVDNSSYYIGSANMDWRSLTQVKEMGVHVSSCPCLASDLYKIFSIYWDMAAPGAKIPDQWPEAYDTYYNHTLPDKQHFSGQISQSYMSVSPPQFVTPSRDGDIDTIIRIMNESKRFIHVAVMDYFPTTLYRGKGNNIYWPVIDDTLRRLAFERGIEIKLLASKWNHTEKEMIDYLKSLQDFSKNIEVKVFEVPSSEEQSKIPYARTNHNKYMVTDQTAYIGTSNWSGDYFIDTAGIGSVFNQTNYTNNSTRPIREQLNDVFERDWFSDYAHEVANIV